MTLDEIADHAMVAIVLLLATVLIGTVAVFCVNSVNATAEQQEQKK